jgi:hypothetical protein
MKTVLSIAIISAVAAATFGSWATAFVLRSGLAAEVPRVIVVRDVRDSHSFTQEQADEFYQAVVPNWVQSAD